MEFVIDNKKILFIHIPKTGGTSVIDLLEKSNTLVNNHYNNNHSHNNQYDPELRQCKQLHLTINDFPRYAESFCFAIVRNPYDRIISEYTWSGNNKLMEFIDFLKHVELNLGHSHYKPQYKYVCDSKTRKLLVDKFYKLEDMKKFYRDITHNFHSLRTHKLEKLNESKQSEKKIKIGKQEIDIINQIYWNDFVIFGYEMINLL